MEWFAWSFWVDYHIVIHTPLLSVDEASGQLWQLVTAIWDESDGPILCE